MTGVRIRFAGVDREVEARIGESILDVALREGIDLDHACGGVCACSTCHVKVTAGADALSPASEDEEDQLDEARDVSLESRLGCQARILRAPAGGVIEVAIPSWNVNVVREGKT
jgi:2Fe-2S ferredoxin